jgi:transposase-like protein
MTDHKGPYRSFDEGPFSEEEIAEMRGAKPTDSECAHEHVSRLAPLYVDGRPLYKCDGCGVRFVYEDDESSFKALAPLKDGDRG